VHLGYVDREVVEAFVVEQLKDSLSELLNRPYASSKFRKGRKTRQDVAPPSTVPELLTELVRAARALAAGARGDRRSGGRTGAVGAPPSDEAVVLGLPSGRSCARSTASGPSSGWPPTAA
jgi:hypothetical protein